LIENLIQLHSFILGRGPAWGRLELGKHICDHELWSKLDIAVWESEQNTNRQVMAFRELWYAKKAPETPRKGPKTLKNA